MRQSQRLLEDWKDHITLKNKTVLSLTSKDHEYDAEKKSLQLLITWLYALVISLLVTRPNTQYTPKHQDSLSFRLS